MLWFLSFIVVGLLSISVMNFVLARSRRTIVAIGHAVLNGVIYFLVAVAVLKYLFTQ